MTQTTTSATILQCAYDLCKATKTSSLRGEIKSILHRFTWTMNGEHAGVFSIGFLGRQRNQQFFGFLDVEARRDDLQGHMVDFPISALPDDIRLMLRSAHEQLILLTSACVAPVIELHPDWHELFDLYNEDKKLPELNNTSKELLSPIPSQALQLMAGRFATHPAIHALVTLERVPDTVWLTQTVMQIERQIKRSRAMKFPETVATSKRASPARHPMRWAWRAVEAVICIRASLRVLNQLLYQQFKYDRLPALGADHIFSIPHWNIHHGSSCLIEYQPDNDSYLLERGDLIILQEIENYIYETRLYEVAHAEFSAGTDGDIRSATLRKVDDNMCPYSDLWNSHWEKDQDLRA